MFDLQSGTSPDPPVEIKIGYVGGGSEGWAHTLLNDLAQTTDVAGEVALYDVDHAAAERNAELGERVSDLEAATGDWTYRACEERADALAGADVVVISTQDPPGETFRHDLDIPKEYGIYQTVGDTVGPGGTIRALRTIPQYRKIAATIREECPDAWVINYTNPMTVCTRTLYEEFPGIDAVGLCHEVFKTQELFADLVAEHRGVESVNREAIDLDVKGINHFTFVDDARWRGESVFALVEELADEYGDLPRFEAGDLDGESYWTNRGDVCVDLYERFGLLGAAGDRHLVEFVPWYLDVDREAEIQRWGTRCTPSSARVPDDDPGATEQYLAGEREFALEDSGEEVVPIVRALLGFEPLQTNVNLPNRGQLPGLPEGAVVETMALVSGDAIRPLAAGGLPREVRSLVSQVVDNQETLIEAGFAGDLDLAFRAFLNDPLVTLQPDAARALFVDMIEAEREYFEAYDLAGARVLDGEVPTDVR